MAEVRGRWEEGRAWLATPGMPDERIEFTCPLCAGRRMHTQAEHVQLVQAAHRAPAQRCAGIWNGLVTRSGR
jgi:hypothetical protein